MLKKTKLCTGLMVACGGVLLSAGPAAFAQPAPTQSLERVEITGSNIRRTDTETASPVQVITKQELDQSGKGTVAEYLQTLTADGQGSVPFTYGRGFSGATVGRHLAARPRRQRHAGAAQRPPRHDGGARRRRPAQLRRPEPDPARSWSIASKC